MTGVTVPSAGPVFGTRAGRFGGRRTKADRQKPRVDRRWLACVLVIALPWLAGCGRGRAGIASRMTGGDPERGARAIQKYGCETCHTIPGVPNGNGQVGPPLTGIANRAYLAGRLPNTPANMIHWIQHPQQVVPGNVMPEMGVGDREARDIAAYLYTLR